MKPSNNEPRPENSPLGSPESRAAARLLADKRKAALIPVMVTHVTGVGVIDGDAEHQPKEWNIDDEMNFAGQAIYSPLDPETMGNSPVCWMTRQELSILHAKQREYDEYEKRCAIERDASLPSETKVCDPAALDEKKPRPISSTAGAAPQQTEVESSEEPSEERVPIVEARRRPLVRRRPLRHQWPPSAFGG